MTIPSIPSPDKSPDKITPAKPLEADQAIRQPSSGTSFESHLQKGGIPKGVGTTGGPTPMDIARPPSFQTTGLSTNSLLNQAKTIQDTIGTVQQQLNTPNLKLKRSQAHLLRNKLTDAQSYSRSAAAKLGVETAPMQHPSGGGPLVRFLAYLNDGQEQFAAIQTKLEEMAAKGDQLNAGDMLLVQSKMGLAQQEIEFSSTLLSRVTSSITTIMGIQL